MTRKKVTTNQKLNQLLVSTRRQYGFDSHYVHLFERPDLSTVDEIMQSRDCILVQPTVSLSIYGSFYGFPILDGLIMSEGETTGQIQYGRGFMFGMGKPFPSKGLELGLKAQTFIVLKPHTSTSPEISRGIELPAARMMVLWYEALAKFGPLFDQQKTLIKEAENIRREQLSCVEYNLQVPIVSDGADFQLANKAEITFRGYPFYDFNSHAVAPDTNLTELIRRNFRQK